MKLRIAGAASTSVFSEFTAIVRGMSALAIASLWMVKMVTGEEIGLEELGGPAMSTPVTSGARTWSSMTRPRSGSPLPDSSALSPTTATSDRRVPTR